MKENVSGCFFLNTVYFSEHLGTLFSNVLKVACNLQVTSDTLIIPFGSELQHDQDQRVMVNTCT